MLNPSKAELLCVMPFESVKKILVIKLRYIGDVLLVSPVFKALKEHFPNAHITVLVNAGTEAMLTDNPNVDEVLVYDRKIKTRSASVRLLHDILFLRSIRKKRFDMAIDLTSGDRPAIIARASGARYRLAYSTRQGFWNKRFLYTHLGRKDITQHMVLRHLDLLKQFGIPYTDTRLSFPVSNGDRASVDRLLGNRRNIVHIHPVSRLFSKCWRDDYMAELIDFLIDEGFKVVVTASPDPQELARVQNILSMVKGEVLDLSGKVTLKQLGAISERARFFIGVDSAPMHIAGAVGTPVIAFFGPSNEILWGPWCDRKLIIRKTIPCRLPCQVKKECSTYECLDSITPQEAIGHVKDFLNSLNQDSRAAG